MMIMNTALQQLLTLMYVEFNCSNIMSASSKMLESRTNGD